MSMSTKNGSEVLVKAAMQPWQYEMKRSAKCYIQTCSSYISFEQTHNTELTVYYYQAVTTVLLPLVSRQYTAINAYTGQHAAKCHTVQGESLISGLICQILGLTHFYNTEWLHLCDRIYQVRYCSPFNHCSVEYLIQKNELYILLE